MSRRFYLLASLVAAVLLAAGIVVVTTVDPADATFPGKNGTIAFGKDEMGTFSISVHGSSPNLLANLGME